MNIHNPDMTGAVSEEIVFDRNTRDQAYDYGWSHDVFTRTNTPDRVATKLAQKFLPMIEKALEAKGITVKAGVEIECDIEDEYIDQFIEQVDNERLRRVIDAKENKKPKPYFHMHRIGRDGEGGAQAAVKDVLEICTTPESPTRTAYIVRNIKKGLIRATERHNYVKHVGDGRASLSELSTDTPFVKRFDDTGGIALRDGFAPLAKSGTVGEHINLSLYYSGEISNRDSYSSGTRYLTWMPQWNELLGFALAHLIPNDFAMLVGGEDSFDRLESMSTNKHVGGIEHTHKEQQMIKREEVDLAGKFTPEESARVEFRVPDASGNPFLSMLSCLGATYAMLKSVEKVQGGAISPRMDMMHDETVRSVRNDIEASYKLKENFPDTMQEAIELFQDSGNLISILHQLVDEQITEPPENKQYHQDIERFKAAVIARSEQLIEREGGISK